jgi:hypothetical protein
MISGRCARKKKGAGPCPLQTAFNPPAEPQEPQLSDSWNVRRSASCAVPVAGMRQEEA